eukprot:c27053_g1_i3 orf=622-2628(-)
MSSKMKIQELRDALAKRGLDITGTKRALVSRLDAAIMQEQNIKKSNDDNGNGTAVALVVHDLGTDCGDSAKKDKANKSLKRSVNDENNDDANLRKVSKTEAIDNWNVADLREALTKRGLSSSGNKKTLLSRLTTALNKENPLNDSKAEDKTDTEANDGKIAKVEKLVVVTKKGHAVLDNFLPDHIRSGYHVLETEDGIYDAMLNQTNVGDNNNKFYVMQVLESDSAFMYYVYNRWGRVGVKGQDKMFGPYYSKDTAINEFEAKFLEKTRNRWSDRQNFQPHSKKYTWLERDYGDKELEAKGVGERPKGSVTSPQESKLDKRLADFISCICNLNMMKRQMTEIGYDANKMPLGKLSKSTILKGYEALKKIAAVLEGSRNGSLEQLSSEFYTVIPHDFGFHKMRNFIIDSPQMLKRKLEMVEALGEIEFATKILGSGGIMEDDPIYGQYKCLKCHLEPIDIGSDEFEWINEYVRKTHAETHGNYTLEVLNIFRARREDEDDRYKRFAGEKNRMLLWHGSRLTNWTGILSQGLRIAPPEAPATGYMFGKGVYFADMVSKSANYCYASVKYPEGVLLLCEVALGDMRKLRRADYNADKLPSGKLSTKGLGSTEPDPAESKILPDGVIIPMGKPVKKPGSGGSLLYNEYIVYNVAQIRMRYVLQVNFNYSHRK